MPSVSHLRETSDAGSPLVSVRPSAIQGDGVFAVRDVAAGELVLTLDDSQVVLPGKGLSVEQGRFCDFLAEGQVAIMQAPERHINHSCDPNVVVQSTAETRQVRALHPIRAGDEITFDYSINGFGDTTWTCHCQAQRCRHTIHSDFFHLPLHLQYEYLPFLETWYRTERAEEVRRLEASAPSIM